MSQHNQMTNLEAALPLYQIKDTTADSTSHDNPLPSVHSVSPRVTGANLGFPTKETKVPENQGF